jgi:hypothetical protein
MPENDEQVLQALNGFTNQVWDHNEEKARMAAEILWQCRTSILTGGVTGGIAGADLASAACRFSGWQLGRSAESSSGQ